MPAPVAVCRFRDQLIDDAVQFLICERVVVTVENDVEARFHQHRMDGFKHLHHLLSKALRRLPVPQELVRSVQDQLLILSHNYRKNIIVSKREFCDYFEIIHSGIMASQTI